VSTISSGSSQSLFNLVVLIASMAGSLVAVFGILIAFLEGKLDLRSVRGAPVAKGDVIRYHSERTEDLEQRAEELQRDNEQQKLQIGHLMKTIDLLAKVAVPTDSAAAGAQHDLHGELYRQLALMTASSTPDLGSNSKLAAISTPDSGSDSKSAIAAAPSVYAYAAPPPRHNQNDSSGSSQEDSLRSRRWSTDEGWTGCPISNIDAAGGVAATMVEMTQVGAPLATAAAAIDEQHAGAEKHSHDDAASSFAVHSASTVDSSLVGITVHAHTDAAAPSVRSNDSLPIVASAHTHVDVDVAVDVSAHEQQQLAVAEPRADSDSVLVINTATEAGNTDSALQHTHDSASVSLESVRSHPIAPVMPSVDAVAHSVHNEHQPEAPATGSAVVVSAAEPVPVAAVAAAVSIEQTFVEASAPPSPPPPPLMRKATMPSQGLSSQRPPPPPPLGRRATSVGIPPPTPPQ
jgi:hypothetical protein